MHKIQKVLLKRLAIQNDQKYADLTRGYNFENNVVFHLNQLVENRLVEKKEGVYTITPVGIKGVYNYELTDLSDPGIKTFFCGFKVTDGQGNFLLKGHPTAKVNFYNLPSGRPKFGEQMEISLVRLFKQNTGIELGADRFEYRALHVKIVKTESGDLLFDDGQAMFWVTVSPNEKVGMKLMKGVEWFNLQQVRNLNHCWPEIKMCILNETIIPYASYEIVSNYKL